MEYKSLFLSCWLIDSFGFEVLRFVSNSFSSFLLHSLVFFLSVEAVRELRTEGKRQAYSRLKLYFEVYNYSVVKNPLPNQQK